MFSLHSSLTRACQSKVSSKVQKVVQGKFITIFITQISNADGIMPMVPAR